MCGPLRDRRVLKSRVCLRQRPHRRLSPQQLNPMGVRRGNGQLAGEPVRIEIKTVGEFE